MDSLLHLLQPHYLDIAISLSIFFAGLFTGYVRWVIWGEIVVLELIKAKFIKKPVASCLGKGEHDATHLS
jgi:hypothetical protein